MIRDASPQPGEKVAVAASAPEVETIRDRWRAAGVAVLDADIDYFLTYVRNSSTVIRPHVVLLQREDGRDVLGIARVEQLSVPLKLGYWTVGTRRARAVVAAFRGIVGDVTESDRRLVLGELMEPLRRGEADVLILPKVPCESALHATAAGLLPRYRRGYGLSPVVRWSVPLPDTVDNFLGARSAKTRKKMRRDDRTLEAAFDVEVRSFDQPADTHMVKRDIARVASKSYQHALGVAPGGALDWALIDEGLKQGWYRAWVLYLDGSPAAYWQGTLHDGTFATGTPGFDPTFAQYSVGRYTMLRMVEALCLDSAVQRLDFGHGDADYKAAFATEQHQELDIMMFARGPRGLVLNALMGAFSGVNAVAGRLLLKSRRGSRLKAKWRARLQRATG